MARLDSNAPFRSVDRKNTYQAHLVAASGELIGTTLFLFLAFGGTQVAQSIALANNVKQDYNELLYISFSFGISLAVVAWAFYRISGGLFNPAVVLGMVVSGTLPPLRAAFLVPAELLGGLIAAALASCMFPTPLGAQTTLGNGTSIVQGLFIEMLLTSVLVFTILMLAAEKNNARAMAPLAIGLSLFICELVGVNFTGGSLNPTRSFGPCVIEHSFPGYHWIYWLGPAMGACLAAGYFRLMKNFNYEDANPGQDDPKDGEV